MCDKSFVLVIFLILKILILVVTPIVIYYLYKKEKKEFNIVAVIDILFIVAFIILKLVGNSCITNSNISYINKTTKSSVHENTDVIYETINPTSKYRNKDNKYAYFYGINYEPLKNTKLSCGKKSYMNNYGSSISALTTLISNLYGMEINEASVISKLEKDNLINCEKGIDFDSALNKLSDNYRYTISKINRSQVDDYISNGKSVLVETKNINNEKNNFGCEKDYIVIYNKNHDGNYSIINPNDKNYSYFCPSNTIGYGSIIEKNQNQRTYTLEEIDSKATRYIVIEVK